MVMIPPPCYRTNLYRLTELTQEACESDEAARNLSILQAMGIQVLVKSSAKPSPKICRETLLCREKLPDLEAASNTLSTTAKKSVKKANGKKRAPTLRFHAIFSQRTYKPLPTVQQIAYDETDKSRPLFDEQWKTMLLHYCNCETTIYDPLQYLSHAQILLDRLLEKKPELKRPKNKLHPNIMMMALHLAIKSYEDSAIWNADIIFYLEPKKWHLTWGDHNAFNSMELAFLTSIDFNLYINSSTSIINEKPSF